MMICIGCAARKGFQRLIIGSRWDEKQDYAFGADLTKENLNQLEKVVQEMRKAFEVEDAAKASTAPEL